MANHPHGPVERLDGHLRSGAMTAAEADEPVYRCYFLDERGRVATAAVIERTDDAGAIGDALALLTRHNTGGRQYAGIELWDRSRLVHASVKDAARDDKPPRGA